MDARAQQLPRGRHGLTREAVLASQRSRLLDAVIGVVAETGLPAATVGQIVQRAGVSRETFYEHFSSKLECFVAAAEAAVDRLDALARTAVDCSPDPFVRLDAFLEAYLGRMREHPDAAKASLLELRQAGAEGLRKEAQWRSQLLQTVAELLDTDDTFACELFVTGFVRLAVRRLSAGDLDGVPAMRGPLVEIATRLFPRP